MNRWEVQVVYSKSLFDFFLALASIILARHSGSLHRALAAAFLAALTSSLLAISLLLAVCFALLFS